MMELHDIAAWLTNLDTDLLANLLDAETEAEEFGLKRAHELSQGPLSLAWLAQDGHPYATRFVGPPPQDTAIINKQGDGRFDASWSAQAPRTSRGDITWSLINSDPVAAWLDEGTSKMIARPFRQDINDHVEVKRAELANRAVQTTFSKR